MVCRELGEHVASVETREGENFGKQKSPEFIADRNLQANFSRINSQYSLSQEQYNEMLENQMGLCAICSKTETRTRNGKLLRLCIDHDAETGQIRGLLCSKCNVAIGMLGHDPMLVSEAVNYLLKWISTD
jgi:hypothetical protein